MVERSLPKTETAVRLYSFNVAPMLREQVAKGTISKVVVVIKDKLGTSAIINNRCRFRARESSSTTGKPTLKVTHSTPVTGEATATFASPPPVAEGEVGSGQVNGEATATFGTSVVVEGFVGEPPTVTGQTIATFETPLPEAYGGCSTQRKTIPTPSYGPF